MALTLSTQCVCFIMCLFIVAANMADISVCKQNFKYHQSSHTCIALIQQSAFYSTSREACMRKRGGPNGDIAGHLVYIYDQDTDEFVKNLLPKATDAAFIGLNFILTGNKKFYRWGDNREPIDYKGWDGNVSTPQDLNVVISRTGWRLLAIQNSAYYVCQVDAGFDRPTMTCPALQEEQPSPEIQCVINKGLKFSRSEFRARSMLTSCTATCVYREGYVGRINEKGTRISMSLSISHVRRSDEGSLTCDWNVSGGSEILSTSCNITVYVAPNSVTCSHTFNATRAIIQCNTARMYPKGACTWRTFNPQVEPSPTINVDFQDQGYLYYSTTCIASFKPTSGNNTVSVSMYPVNGNGQKISETLEATTDYIFIMEPPTTPPELITSPNHVSYKEGDTISISCTVSGGSPPVHRTRLSCDPEIKATKTTLSVVNESGNKAVMEVNITVEMNGKTCNCSADHISLQYREKNMMILSVIAPAKATSLYFKNGGRDVSEVDVDRNVQITCSASGNPRPLLSLYYTDHKQLLKNETGYKITHGVQTSCHDSGTYICAASNNLSKVPHQLERNLRVKCRQTYCNTEESNPKFAVVLNTDAIIEMCVFVNAKPSKYYLYKDFYTYSSDRYTFQFNFTNEVQSRGLITLTLRNVTPKDLGTFSWYIESVNFPGLYFTLVEQGPPSCPGDIQIRTILNDIITLVWRPGHDGGLRQTFIIVKHDVMKEVGRVQDTANVVMEYNVTGLCAMTSYNFSIQVENEKGRINCSHFVVTTNVLLTTNEKEDDSLKTYLTVAFTNIFTALCVASAILVYIRRKRHREILLRQNNFMPIEDNITRANQSPAPGLDSTHVNAAYCECVPTQPNAEHPYQQILPESSFHVILTSTEDGYLLPNNCGPTVDNTNPDNALFLSQLPVTSPYSEYEQLDDPIPS